MNSGQANKSFENGKKVWDSLLSQLEEGRGFLSAAISSFRRFILKFFLVFLVFSLLGAAGGALAWYLKPRLYEAEMTVSYVHYERKIYADMLQKLDLLASSGNYSSLSTLLKMPEEKLSALKSVNSLNIKKEPLINDLGTDRIPFYILVKVTDTKVLPELQASLVDYLSSSEFIRERLAFSKKRSLEELEFYQKRLDVVDSLSRQLVVKEKNLNEESVTRMELLEEAQAVHSKIQELKGSIRFNKNIEVLDPFIPTGRPVGKGLRDYLLLGIVAGCVLGFLIILTRKPS